MNICILGDGLTGLTVSKSLVNKKLKVFMYYQKNKYFKDSSTRTVGISKNNFDFFNNKVAKFKSHMFCKIKKIEVYSEKNKNEKILEFERLGKELFYILKNETIHHLLEKELKKNPLFKKKLIKNNNFYKKILNEKKFDLIINCDGNNIISKNIFYKKIFKDYKSSAYTALIKHKKIINDKAIQIFTKNGPIAFLPISNNETSVVFSKVNNKDQFNSIKLENIIFKYAVKYKIKNISKIKKFPLILSISRKYFEKNIMALGDALHKIHPHAGQGFNMTLRDIKILSNIIDERLNLGLPLDYSIYEKFENKTKHFNFIFSTGIDLIYEFFKINNKMNNNLPNKIVKLIGNNKFFNEVFSKYADKGITI